MPPKINLLRELGISGYSLRSAIQVGPLFVSPNEIESHLGRYVHRLVSETDDETYQFQHLGSATGIKYRGKHFIISTNHQRVIGAEGKIGILLVDPSVAITPCTMWTPEQAEIEDGHDFTIFRFDPRNYDIQSLESQFVDIGTDFGVNVPQEQIAVTIGYPTSYQNIDYYDGNVNLVAVSCTVELLRLTSTKDVYEFRTLSDDRMIEDGFSGAPVFEIESRNQSFRIRWVGVVVRGGQNSRFGRMIDSTSIVKQIDKVVF